MLKFLALKPFWIPSSIFCLILVGCGPVDRPSLVKYTSEDQTIDVGRTLRWDFDETPAEAPPINAEVLSGNWIVQRGENVPSSPHELCQTATEKFPAIRLGSAIVSDLTMTAKVKPISGTTDQAAGLIFRMQDAQNYYVLRANALEGSVSFYIMADGKHSFIKEDKVEVQAGQWQTLSVKAQGENVQAFLNDQLIVEAQDKSFAAGQVGLWTKADSVTCFDTVSLTVE